MSQYVKRAVRMENKVAHRPPDNGKSNVLSGGRNVVRLRSDLVDVIFETEAIRLLEFTRKTIDFLCSHLLLEVRRKIFIIPFKRNNIHTLRKVSFTSSKYFHRQNRSSFLKSQVMKG